MDRDVSAKPLLMGATLEGLGILLFFVPTIQAGGAFRFDLGWGGAGIGLFLIGQGMTLRWVFDRRRALREGPP